MLARRRFLLLFAIVLMSSWGRSPALELILDAPDKALVDDEITLLANASGGTPPYQFRFTFGDGTSTAWQIQAAASHSYADARRAQCTVEVTDASSTKTTATQLITIHHPILDLRPTSSQTIAYDPVYSRLWVANPDQDTVTRLDPGAGIRLSETSVPARPSALALAGDGDAWVVCRDADRLLRLDAADGSIVSDIALAYGARPVAIAAIPTSGATTLAVVCRGRRELLQLDADGSLLTRHPLGPDPQHLSIVNHDQGPVAWIVRHRSSEQHGSVQRIRLTNGAELDEVILPLDTGPDTEASGRGLPNYLARIAISPDGRCAWLPAKKDNIVRGALRDGLALNFESTVRSITCLLDVDEGVEMIQERIDHNDAADAVAVQFSRLGDITALALRGIDRVDLFETGTRARLASIATGASPIAVLFDASGRLFVHEFLDRHVAVYDLADFLATGDADSITLDHRIATSAGEKLSNDELAGKQLFYAAKDSRINRDHYIACASCHTDGGHDGRIWDFTDRGEGLRNTPTLRGRRGTGHGPVHWTANFDEIQDFEHDIRGPFGGTGLMDDATFFSGERFRSLGGSKAGHSVELDALAAYVASLDSYPRSPHRHADGSASNAALRGRALFAELNCIACHGGPDFTDSASGRRHDIGTIRPSSGKRLGGDLDGIDTPTLRGLWATAPYLHDGSAVDLSAVFAIGDRFNPHGLVRTRSAQEQADLATFLLQLDGSDALVSTSSSRRIRIRVDGVTGVSAGIRPQHAPAVSLGDEQEFNQLSRSLDYRIQWQTDTAPLSLTWHRLPADGETTSRERSGD